MKYLRLLLPIIFLLNIPDSRSFGQTNDIGSGIAMTFPGTTGSRVDLGNVYNDLNFPVTVEAWVYPTGWTPLGFSPIISTDNVGVGGHYYGFWFRFNSSGNLIFEIGDGFGAGGSDRRGKRTTTVAPLNKWTHVAVVANSITDVNFYFNGVLQSVVNTDGGAVNTTILHTSYPAYLGCQITPTTEHDFTGTIDEVRLWNVARSITDLRDKMCEKLTGSEPGLIGNWRFDEDYLSTTVDDYSASGINGSVFGTAAKVTSGAPIGDVSTLVYSTDYSGVSLNLNSPGGDKLKINKIGYNPHGVHLYRVDDYPYFTSGLLSTPIYYYGVFPANDVSDAKYTLTYTYTFLNGVVNEGNETEATLYKRTDNSITDWTFMPAPLDTLTNRLSKKNFVGRSEFIFSIDTANSNGGTKFAQEFFITGASDLELYPNPTTGITTCQGLVTGYSYVIMGTDGKILMSDLVREAPETTLDLSALAPGMYFVAQLYESKWHYCQFVKL